MTLLRSIAGISQGLSVIGEPLNNTFASYTPTVSGEKCTWTWLSSTFTTLCFTGGDPMGPVNSTVTSPGPALSV